MQWQRSSFCSANNCVEVAPWTRATGRSKRGCVEVWDLNDVVSVRDSKEPGKHLVFTREEWESFTAGVKAGEFDK